MKERKKIEQTIADMLKSKELSRLSINDFANWDSIDKMNFFLLIEETFNIEFEANELIGLNSMEAIITLLYERHCRAD